VGRGTSFSGRLFAMSARSRQRGVRELDEACGELATAPLRIDEACISSARCFDRNVAVVGQGAGEGKRRAGELNRRHDKERRLNLSGDERVFIHD